MAFVTFLPDFSIWSFEDLFFCSLAEFSKKLAPKDEEFCHHFRTALRKISKYLFLSMTFLDWPESSKLETLIKFGLTLRKMPDYKVKFEKCVTQNARLLIKYENITHKVIHTERVLWAVLTSFKGGIRGPGPKFGPAAPPPLFESRHIGRGVMPQMSPKAMRWRLYSYYSNPSLFSAVFLFFHFTH